MSDYPLTLPLPLVAEYAVQTVVGVSAVSFERGNNRQRRTASRERHTFSLSFVLTTAQLWEWQSWANQSGYDWHLMNLESAYSALSGSGARLVPHYVRYISDITIETLGGGYLRVLVSAELDLGRVPASNITPTGNWYVGGTPATPAANTITAGTPASPAVNTITAGTPILPAA